MAAHDRPERQVEVPETKRRFRRQPGDDPRQREIECSYEEQRSVRDPAFEADSEDENARSRTAGAEPSTIAIPRRISPARTIARSRSRIPPACGGRRRLNKMRR